MNNKLWLKVRLILLILMFLMLSGIAVTAINFSRLGGNKLRMSFANSMPIEKGEKKAFSDVEKIVIDSISLPVDIYESDVTQVTIQDNSTGTRRPNKVSYKNGILSFSQAKPRPFLNFIRGNVVVEVPRGSVLEYDIEGISGGIVHDAMSKGTLRTESISGSIKIYQGGETVVAEAISGSVQIAAPFKKVTAESISGSVNILANQDSKEVSGSSVSGSIRIQLDKVTGYEMDYSTVSGSVKDTYSNNNYSKSGRATNGDESLKIRASSVSGSVKLTDWE